MEYNGYNQLVNAYIDGVEASYSYRPDGLCHAKTVDGVTTRHLWDGQNIVADAVNGSIQQKYIRGIGLLAAEDSQGTRIGYLFNAHGDVIQRTDSAGNVTKGYDYDAFGVEKAPEAADTNPFRYCGEHFDAETGSVYLRNRYYDPRTGRFGAEDPIRDGLNWYTYCGGNPVAFVDPSGCLVQIGFINQDDLLAQLQMLTDAKLYIDDNNYLQIIELDESQLPEGTSLLKDLIASDSTVRIQAGKETNLAAKNIHNAINGTGSGAVITLNLKGNVPTGCPDSWIAVNQECNRAPNQLDDNKLGDGDCR